VDQAPTVIQNYAPFDITQVLSQIKVSVPLMELMKVEEFRNKTVSLISGVPCQAKQNIET